MTGLLSAAREARERRGDMRARHRAGRVAVGILLEQLDEAYDRRSWHGTNLRGSLRGVSANEAAWRPAPGRHALWEVAVHAAYWKYAAWRSLTDEKRGSFPRPGSNWFPCPAPATEALWRADKDLLGECHRRLREAVARLADADLARRAAGGKETVGRLVRGIVAHDVYHAGQIQLLKRLRRA
jgi:uncharacterized damage-inducible protein DinB